VSTLENIWNTIEPRVGEATAESVAVNFLMCWNHDLANMDMIVQAIEIYKPRVSIELGTFEGLGAKQIAIAMNKTEGGELYTFDAGKAPITMGEPYGVTEKYLIDGHLVDWKNIDFEGWNDFGKVIDKRNKILRELKNLNKVKVTFVEGLTWDTLPIWMPKIGVWDFLFQDSTHDLEEMIIEWELYEPYSKIGSLIVMDDIHLNFPQKEYFMGKDNWKWFHTEIGHKQLWGERIR
jgi:predicted O-methyltransferase YrrM